MLRGYVILWMTLLLFWWNSSHKNSTNTVIAEYNVFYNHPFSKNRNKTIDYIGLYNGYIWIYGKKSEISSIVRGNTYLLEERALPTVVGQLSEQNQLTLSFAIVLLAGSLFHGERDVIGLEIMYVEDCFENRKSVAVVDVSRVHWIFHALGALLFRRLYNQEVAHLFEVFLQTITRHFEPIMKFCTQRHSFLDRLFPGLTAEERSREQIITWISWTNGFSFNMSRYQIKSHQINTFAMAPHHRSSGVPNIKLT